MMLARCTTIPSMNERFELRGATVGAIDSRHFIGTMPIVKSRAPKQLEIPKPRIFVAHVARMRRFIESEISSMPRMVISSIHELGWFGGREELPGHQSHTVT